MTDIKRVGVLGCGLMGSGIAQVAASAGYDTIVRDVSQQVWDKARAGIERSLAKFVEKGKQKSTRLNSSHRCISYAVFCLKKKKHAITSTLSDVDDGKPMASMTETGPS